MDKKDVTLDQMMIADQDYFRPILESHPDSPLASQISEYRDRIKLQQSRGRVKQRS